MFRRYPARPDGGKRGLTDTSGIHARTRDSEPDGEPGARDT